MIARSAAHQIKYYVLAVSEWVFTRAGWKANIPKKLKEFSTGARAAEQQR